MPVNLEFLMPRVNTAAVYPHTVRSIDLATNWGNDVPVLATPVLLWLSEIAAMKVTDRDPEFTGAGLMSLGFRHESSHVGAAFEGWDVSAQARLADIDGAKLRYDVQVVAGDGTVLLTGSHIRAVVVKSVFLSRLGLPPT